MHHNFFFLNHVLLPWKQLFLSSSEEKKCREEMHVFIYMKQIDSERDKLVTLLKIV